MYTVTRNAHVMHSAESMYALVCDIDSYSRFLPWCGGSQVLMHDGKSMTARVRINYRGVQKSFTTRNKLQPFDRIEMELVDGPFSELAGAWRFTALRADACKIELHLRFDFANAIARKLVAPVFKRIADSMVESFVARAEVLHAAAHDADALRVEVVYVSPSRQEVVQLRLRPPVDIARAIEAAGLARKLPQEDFACVTAGVFGVPRGLDWELQDGDRVEVYRPLLVSPGEARRRRAGQHAPS